MEQRQRTGRRIKLNHSNATPRFIISFDCETLPEPGPTKRKSSHHFRLATTTEVELRKDRPETRRRNQFTDPEKLWEHIASRTSRQYTTWLIGHNVLFDLVVSGFPGQLLTSKFYIDWPRSKRQRENNEVDDPHTVGLCCIESPPTIIALRCNRTGGRIVIVDSLNWFPVPLSEMGDNLGLEKLPFPSFEAPDSEWFTYCQRDSDIVLETFVGLIRWVKEGDYGMFRYTGSSQAMAAYRHRFMRQQILVHDNPPAKHLERMSYCGGRTEVFRKGSFNCRVYQLDINSLFPSIMQSGVFPFVLDRSDNERVLAANLPDICWADSVAEVELQTMEPIFPLRRDGVTIYPIGKFVTTLCGHELHYAHSHGYIRRCGKWNEYRCGDLFSLWVDELWALRQQYKAAGNDLYDQFAKRMLNSLYGKFGQRAPGWINKPGDISALPWSRWIKSGKLPNEVIQCRSIGWTVQEQTDREEIEGSFVAISSFVTSAARMKMNSIRWTAGQREVFYQGVDSVIVTEAGFARLAAAGMIGDNELGKLRLQCEVDNGEILGCADYRLGDKVVIAGRARKMTLDEDGQIMQRKFDATQNLFTGKAINTVEESLEPWTRAGMYRKGDIDDEGWVHPYILGICEAAMAQQGVPF